MLDQAECLGRPHIEAVSDALGSWSRGVSSGLIQERRKHSGRGGHGRCTFRPRTYTIKLELAIKATFKQQCNFTFINGVKFW